MSVSAKFEADTYEGTNLNQRRDAKQLFEKLKQKYAGRQLNTVVDIGCGYGDVTSTINNYVNSSVIVAFDLSPDMIERAKQTNASSNIRYEAVSVTKDFNDLSEILKITSPVDLIVSIYCLHWVKDEYPAALRNIYGLLAPGAEAYLMVYLGSDILKTGARVLLSPRWAKYFPEIAGMTEETAADHLFPGPKNEILAWKSAANEIGFVEVDLKFRKADYVYDSIDHFIVVCKGINGETFSKIPPDELEDFMMNMCQAVHEEYYANQDCYPKFRVDYEYVIIKLKKPENGNCRTKA